MLYNFEDSIGTNSPDYIFSHGAPAAPIYDQDQISQKTTIASYGLKDLYTYPEIRSYYDSGDEDLFKVNASARANLENTYRTEALFRAGKITSTQQINQLYQPTGVVERKFADRAINQFLDPSRPGTDEDGTYAEIAKTSPYFVQGIQDAAKRNAALVTAFTMARNDVSKRIENASQGFFGFLNQYGPGRLASVIFSPLTDIKHALTEPNLEAKRQELIRMPLNDALSAIEDLKKHYRDNDPEQGIHFFNYMLQPNKIDEGQEQFFRMLNIAGVAAGVPGAGKALLKGFETSRMMKEFTQRIPEAVNSNPWRVFPAASGDPAGSAFRRVADEEAKRMIGNPDPTKEATDSMMSVFQTNARDFALGGPSRDGNAAFNIISEQAQRAGIDMAELSRRSAKVIGVQETLAMEGVAEGVLKEAVESNPQLHGHIINTLPFQLNEHTGLLSVDHIIGTPSGGYYNSASKIIAVMEKELNLPVTNIHGHPFPYTGESPVPGAGIGFLENVKVQGNPRVTLRNPTSAEVNVPGTKGVKDVSQAQKPIIRPGVFSEGKGFYGVVTVPINPNSPIMKSAMVELEAKRAGGLISQILGNVSSLRTPEEVLSQQLMAQRKVAMFTPGLFQKLVALNLKPAGQAKRAEALKFSELKREPGTINYRGAFTRALENGQKNKQWFKDLPELDAYYMKAEGRLPTDTERKGYFAYKLGRLMDQSFRDLAVTKVMGQHGVERHVFTKMEGGAPPLSKGTPVKSDEVLASTLKEMPIDHPNARVLIQEGDSFKIKRLNKLSEDDKALMAKVQTGERKGLKLWNSESFPLQDFAGTKKRDFFEYVVSDNVESRPLNSFKLPRVDGRLEYNFSHYLKQGDFAYDEERSHYLGDRTIMALENRAVGKVTAKALNTARLAIKKGGEEGIAEAQAATRDLPIEWKDIKDKFDNGEWDLNAEFHVVPSGKSVSDIPGALGDARNTFRSGSPHNQFARVFTGADDPFDIFAMKAKNTVYNPSLSYNKAEFLDPYVSMNRSLSRMINSTFMEDVKFNSINSWMTRHGDKLDWGKYARQDNPYQAFVHAELDKTMSPYERAQIEAEREMIKSFNSIPSTQESWIYRTEQALADGSFEGSSATKRGAALATRWTFDKAVKTPAVLRAFAYRFGLGLFNPSQFFTQLNTFTNLFTIGGLEAATKGTAAALLHTVSNLPMVGPEALAGLDKVATRFGWKPGQWMELRQHMLDTGFHLVSKETNELRASMYPNKLFKSTIGQVFDAGDLFFNAGEKFSRYGAWYTAADKGTQGLGKMDLVTRQNVLNEADKMMSNMTAASRSKLQTGLGSLPSQFLGYWLRTAELFTGSRLSTVQKARMFGAYSMLYGLPSGLALTGVGALTTNIPFEQMLTKAAVDHGWLPENSKISQVFFQGLSSAMVSAITGRDYSLGTKFGIGPGRGLDIWTQDKSIWEIFTGPVGDMLGQTMGNIDPLVRAGWGAISGNDERRHLTPDDWRRLLSVIGTFSQASKLWYALQYHEWQSRNENPILSNVSTTEASLMAVLGIQPEASNRLALVQTAGKLVEKEITRLTEQARLDQQRYFRAITNGEDSIALEHWRNLNVTMAQIPADMKTAVWASIMRANTHSVPDNATWNYFNGRHKLTNNSSNLSETYADSIAPMMGK